MRIERRDYEPCDVLEAEQHTEEDFKEAEHWLVAGAKVRFTFEDGSHYRKNDEHNDEPIRRCKPAMLISCRVELQVQRPSVVQVLPKGTFGK